MHGQGARCQGGPHSSALLGVSARSLRPKVEVHSKGFGYFDELIPGKSYFGFEFVSMSIASSLTPELLARFPATLPLPESPHQWVADAGEAVKREYRNSVKWKRLRCRSVAPLERHGDSSIVVLDVGHSIEFDWTWEGAIAFRPVDFDGFHSDIDACDDFVGTSPERSGAWVGEVVEVDETNGRVFVSVSSPESPPRAGSFYVRPFEFLAFLHSIYCEPEYGQVRNLLGRRLNACRGNIHPLVTTPGDAGLDELKSLWKYAWGILWGPPGTGKTHTLGRQVASCLTDTSERVLVVSTTNKATDAAAIAVGRSTEKSLVEEGRILRIGKSAGIASYQALGLDGMLRGAETDLLYQIAGLSNRLAKAATPEERAVLRKQVRELRRLMKDSAFNCFASPEVRVVVATSFKALTLVCNPAIRDLLLAGTAPFTTVIMDEAGLLSRATAAVLSLLASRRVVLVGDSKQLAPISKISRILPTSQSAWLASSPLSHLQNANQVVPGVHMLREQHRMHPSVSRVVSEFQYDGQLNDAPAVLNRPFTSPPLLHEQPRAIWYVLDEDTDDLPSIRAERPPGNRSWVRPRTRAVLKKLFADPSVAKAQGVFVSPFAAQARDIARFLAEEHLESWSAATVHSQQGTEADIIIFDTVNAGSIGWPYDEWKRLVNVGLSRAKEHLILLASRAEMNEPYLRPLLRTLPSRVLGKSGKDNQWKVVPAHASFAVPPDVEASPDLLGNQLRKRKSLRPVMSAEQQRLSGYKMDGKPRLVRGVAGSGKTVVLAHWLQKTVQQLSGRQDCVVWAVYANRSLARLIADTVEEAWAAEHGDQAFPWKQVHLWHIKDILEFLLPEVGLTLRPYEFDYDKAAEHYLQRRPVEGIPARCHALFIDEAQDMGPNTLKLLSALVQQTDPGDPKSRSINIFYDNAQNIYGRSTPRWSEIGLDMVGRSTVMKESFRSTVPITEFALNLLYRLQPPTSDLDHKELVKRGLIESTRRNGKEWWQVRFNQVDGPSPVFKQFASLEAQVSAIADQVYRWVQDEGVRPRDICVLCADKAHGERIADETSDRLKQLGARAVYQAGQAFDPDDMTVPVTTSHSFKGYDAEVVVIGGVERFVADKKILANNLFVAMTRARSILAVFAYRKKKPTPQEIEILTVVQDCLDAVVERPKVEREISRLDDQTDLLDRIGGQHREWLTRLWNSRWIEQEPMFAEDGEILGEPLFWFKEDDRLVACFENGKPGVTTTHKLEDAGVLVIHPGQDWTAASAKVSSPVPVPSVVELQAKPTSPKPGGQTLRYSPKYTSGHWCVTRYATSGKPMWDRRVFPTYEEARQYADTMKNATVKPTIEQLP